MEKNHIDYSQYVKDWQHIDDFIQKNIKSELIWAGEELFRILSYVHAPEDNPAVKNKEEESILVYLLINCAQWLQSCRGSYKMLSLSGVASAIRGIYECFIAIKFLIGLSDTERKKYVERYNKFKYAEKMSFKKRTTSIAIKSHEQIDDDYNKYARSIFEYINKKDKKAIRKDWTAEGWGILALTLKAGLNKKNYEIYFTWPSQYIHNTSIIRPFFSQRIPIPDPGDGIRTLEITLRNSYILAGELIVDYAKHFGKKMAL